MKKEVVCLPEENPQFTVFHGCSFPCHDGQVYHAEPCEVILNPKDLNIVTGGLFENRENLKTQHFLFGHTHIPGYFCMFRFNVCQHMATIYSLRPEQKIEYGNGIQRFGINPGSAGVRGKDFPRTALSSGYGRANLSISCGPGSLFIPERFRNRTAADKSTGLGK